MADDAPASAVTLRALDGEPLADEAVRTMVVATAQAIGERQGVEVLDVATTPSSVTVTLRGGRLESMGLAAELRRLTTAWYTAKYDTDTLWGEPTSDDPADAWKRS